MRIGWMRHVEMGKLEPCVDPREQNLHGKRTRDDSSIGRDAYEPEERHPCQPHTFASREALVPPCARPRMYRRVGIMRVNEDVDVGQDHAS